MFSDSHIDIFGIRSSRTRARALPMKAYSSSTLKDGELFRSVSRTIEWLFSSSRLTSEQEDKKEAIMNLYVGNLDFNITRERLRTMFAQYGVVEEVSVVSDRLTDQYRNFGSVKMENDWEAQQAIRAINGRIVGGRRIVVMESPPSTHHHREGNKNELRWWRRHV